LEVVMLYLLLVTAALTGLTAAVSDPLEPGAVSAGGAGEKAGVPRVIASYPAELGGHLKNMVIRSADELAKDKGGKAKELETQLAKLLKVDRIDWDKQMLLVIYGGQHPTGGYRVELDGLDVKDKELVVRWKLIAPKPGAIVTQVVTRPALSLLVDRFDGPVRFDPAAPPPDKKE
jgi:hypothetical protein